MSVLDDVAKLLEKASAAIDDVDQCQFGRVGKLLDTLKTDVAKAAALVETLRGETVDPTATARMRARRQRVLAARTRDT